jgi:hypothetical protein
MQAGFDDRRRFTLIHVAREVRSKFSHRASKKNTTPLKL